MLAQFATGVVQAVISGVVFGVVSGTDPTVISRLLKRRGNGLLKRGVKRRNTVSGCFTVRGFQEGAILLKPLNFRHLGSAGAIYAKLAVASASEARFLTRFLLPQPQATKQGKEPQSDDHKFYVG